MLDALIGGVIMVVATTSCFILLKLLRAMMLGDTLQVLRRGVAESDRP